jgi:acetyl-CoA carboxylase / biotin carboxylase 1
METLRSVDDFVRHCGGTKVVQRVLIANNGISAVKAIRSMRQWLYKTLGDECAVFFIVLATPEDMRINAEVRHLVEL